MKLAIIFEVPDDQEAAYADAARQILRRHAFAVQEKIKHWSFDVEMRPIGVAVADTDEDLADEVVQLATCSRCNGPAPIGQMVGPYRVCDACKAVVSS